MAIRRRVSRRRNTGRSAKSALAGTTQSGENCELRHTRRASGVGCLYTAVGDRAEEPENMPDSELACALQQASV